MKFLTPHSLSEGLELRDKYPHYHILAGGTDLYVLINSGFLKPEGILNIWCLDELRGVERIGDCLYIGTLTTYSAIRKNQLVADFAPALVQACASVGACQIQNRGTVGGNVMNASPAGDLLPVLMAYDAEVEVASVKGLRWIEFTKFYIGYRKTALKENEILTRIKIKKADPRERSAFLKVGTRKALAISKVMGCFRALLEDNGKHMGNRGRKISKVAISYGSVAPVPIRLYRVESLLRGANLTEGLIHRAVQSVIQEISPIDDVRSTAAYRRHVAGVLLRYFLESVLDD